MDYSFWERLTGSKRIARGELTPRCDICGTRTHIQDTAKIFLIPVFNDKLYKPSADYYCRNCWPILQVSDIPVGQRACRMWPLVCPKCGAQAVLVVDFLMVRGQEVTEELVVCDYAPLAGLLTGNHAETAHTSSAVQSFEHTDTIGTSRQL